MRTLAAYLTLGFIWLSYASLHHTAQPLVKVSRLQNVTNSKAKQLQKLFDISDDEIAKPVRLFGD